MGLARTIARWRRRAARLLLLPLGELRDLCLAQLYLLTARGQRSMSPRGRYLALGAVRGNEEQDQDGESGLDNEGRAVATHLALAVERASEHGLIRPTCLERAVALEKFLRRRGMPGGRIRVGVRWEGGEFLAHAWVEMGDMILGESPARVQAFASIAQAGTSRS